MTIVLRSRAGVGRSGSCSRTMARALTGAGAGEVLINPGMYPVGSVLVSYGVSLRDARLPTLNANAGVLSKLEELQTLANRGVRTVPFLTNAEMQRHGVPAGEVWFGRKLSHTQGKDIMVVLQPEEIAWRIAAGAAYFTRFIPVAREFRVWAYRRRHMATYEKVMAHPEEYSRVGRSAHQGFAFRLVPSEVVPREAVRQGTLSVDALDLDYGAVDIIQSLDGEFYVLEVNTAPGIEGEERFVLSRWADHVVRWAAHPTRKNRFAGAQR